MLTTGNIAKKLKGTFADFGERLFPLDACASYQEPIFSDPNYCFIRTLKFPEDETHPHVAEYEAVSTGERVVVKSLRHRFRTSQYLHLLREAELLSVIGRLPEDQRISPEGVALPRVHSLRVDHQSISVVMSFAEGESIAGLSAGNRQKIVERVIMSLRYFTRYADPVDAPRITPSYIRIAFPYYLMRVVFRSPNLIALWVRAARCFYTHAASLSTTKSVLTHHDLNPENIFVSGEKITLIDFGRISLAPEESEVVFLERGYWKELDPDGFAQWIGRLIPSSPARKRALALAVFFWVQAVAFNPKGTKNEAAAMEYLEFFLTRIATVF